MKDRVESCVSVTRNRAEVLRQIIAIGGQVEPGQLWWALRPLLGDPGQACPIARPDGRPWYEL
jgi:hypothetical protein